MKEQISARQGKFTSRYCASESDVHQAISNLKWLWHSLTVQLRSIFCCVHVYLLYYL